MIPKTESTTTTCTRKIGLNRGKARLWIEGTVLASQGWEKGTTYVREDYPNERIMVFRRTPAGESSHTKHKPRKVAGEATRPIIDTNTDTLVEVLGVMPGSEVHITITPGSITIREFNPQTDSKAESMKDHHQPVKEFKPGDRVMIYEDPITRQKPEGIAVLVSNNHKPDTGKGNLQGWQVRFFAETHTVCRWIHPDSPVLPK